jgi:predicted ATP-grasp superfamily ATP-dependent carboligase
LNGRFVTEIVTIRSLQELQTRLEAENESYLSQKEEISERLGNFLREIDEEYGDEAWFKQLDLKKLGSKKNDKKRKGSYWVQFKGIELGSSLQGEAEVMFEAISKISEKLEALSKRIESLEELRKVGLGNDVKYICYLEEGVLRKIIIKPVDDNSLERFTFNRGFTVIQTVRR